jgi:integrase
MALEYKPTRYADLTFEDAAKEYISLRKNTLSPRTVEDYSRTLNNYCKRLHVKPVNRITQNDIQVIINELSARLSPKTVSNAHAFISAVLRTYRPDMALNTRLPQRVRPDLYIPSDADVRRLIDALKGTAMELPVMLAAFGPMRRGEICALNAKNIDGNIVHVCENMVKDTTDAGPRKWIIRHPKSYQGDRYIDYPAFVADLWAGRSGRLVTMTPDVLTTEFKRYLRRLQMPDFRFHDLRHYSASIQHALGVPDAYIMQRGGWSTDAVLKSVYRHAMDDRQAEMSAMINDHFSALHDTKHDTKK